MSQNEKTKMNSTDIFSVYQENIDKILYEIKRSVPKYHQSITDAQQEYFEALKNTTDSSIILQKEFVSKVGNTPMIPNTISKMMNDANKEFIKALTIQNQMVLASIDTTQQNIKAFNDNTESFLELNKNIMQSWISIFKTKNQCQ